jgi:hypothetical protein
MTGKVMIGVMLIKMRQKLMSAIWKECGSSRLGWVLIEMLMKEFAHAFSCAYAVIFAYIFRATGKTTRWIHALKRYLTGIFRWEGCRNTAVFRSTLEPGIFLESFDFHQLEAIALAQYESLLYVYL